MRASGLRTCWQAGRDDSVLHIIQQLGPGRGGVRTFVSTMLDCPAPDIEQSVLSVGRVEGDRFRRAILRSFNR